MRKRIKAFLCTAVLAFSVMVQGVAALADTVPYDTYNYDYWDNVVKTPVAYAPDGSVSGIALGCGNFSSPQDIYVAEDGVYVADTGNARVLKLDLKMTKVLEELKTFEYDGKTQSLGSPYGICVSEDNHLYVADKSAKKIWIFSEDRKDVRVIENPKSEILDDDFDFTPLKVSVDYANRVYVVASGKTQGILVFDSEGNFTSFFGTINVNISAWQKFWRRFSTKEERAKQVLFIATEFTGLDVNPEGFVYATNFDTTGVQAVRKLNPNGEDVIRKGEKGTIAGDIKASGTSKYAGVSTIVDIVYRDKGIYSILDSKRGRIFTYDDEGNLLYIFGGLGSQAGTFTVPVAIEKLGDKLIVLDSSRQEIIKFKPTEYGSLIDQAVGLRYDGDETLAVDIWKQVLKLDENYELANDGIGKAYLTAGDNELAMKHLKLAMDRKYYSIAFRRYRNAILSDNLQYILTGIIVLIVAVQILKRVIRKKKGLKEEEGLL